MNRMHLLPALALLLGIVLPAGALDLAESRTVRADRVNVRVEPSREAEVLFTLKRGDAVEVRGAESGGWTRIAVPPQVPIWVFGPLVDVPAQKIRAKEANLRSGPGKNYSELGRLRQGDRVAVIRESDGWVQIEPPANISAFISTGLLAGAEDSAVSRKPRTPVPASEAETVVGGVEAPPERVESPAPPKADPSASKASLIPSETQSAVKSEVVEAVSSNSQSTIVANSTGPKQTQTPVTPVATPVTTPITTPITTPAPVPVTTASPPPNSSTTVAYVEGSQPLLQYSESVRTVVRVGRVGLSLEPQSPSYFELVSVLRGEGRLGFLAAEDDSIRFGTFRGKVVRVVAEEFQTTGSPAKTVLRVKSILLEPGY